MSDSKPTYCWDTSVFLAWLNREENKPLADIDLLIDDIHAKKANLVMSVTTYSEMLTTKHTPEQLEMFNKFLMRRNIQRVPVTFGIAQKAAEVRSRGETIPDQQGNIRKIKTPDATIIATAIVYKVTALHSCEPKHHRLSRSEIVDGILITNPGDFSGQQALNLVIPPNPEKSN